MNLEETKKIIRNKIEADEAAREVRSQIKSYIDQKQNLREGFTETFKPLIETSEAVKTSIDTQQNKLIKQLQDNQLEDKYAYLIKDDNKIDYFSDPKYKVLEVIRKNEEEEEDPTKRVITFDDTDLDSGLNNARAVNFLKENNIPLPSRIKNESYKTIKYYHKKS